MEQGGGYRKVLQRQLLTLVSSRRAMAILLIATVITLNSAFQFGESVVEWSQNKYLATINRFRDNLAGASFEDRLCSPVPIDIVYTWVNGSDPVLQAEIAKYKELWLLEHPEIASATPSASPRATTTTATGQATMRALRSIASNEQRELSEQLLRKAIDESTDQQEIASMRRLLSAIDGSRSSSSSSSPGADAAGSPTPTAKRSSSGTSSPTISQETGSHMKAPEDHFSASRFKDNGELQYSLRSIEKFAPWVRNVYIVTNGQVPNWLNLQHPRLFVITHEQIFLNKSHLPTFSSPSIESHLHRIPGLSTKFVYLNDDVMFGSEVWPDDFFTHSNGQKVYLSWPVPQCSDGCSSNWIGDKFCDRACNNTACDWDGGDCLNSTSSSSSYSSSSYTNPYKSSAYKYCEQGCPDTWLGDRYCDRACNNVACGFDGTDCGIDQMREQLYSVNVTNLTNIPVIVIPKGVEAFYINLNDTELATRGDRLSEGKANSNAALRTVGYAEKHKWMTITLQRNISQTVSFVDLSFLSPNGTFMTVTFTIVTNTNGTEPFDLTNLNTTRVVRTEDQELKVKINTGTTSSSSSSSSSYSSTYSSSSSSSSSHYTAPTTAPKFETVGLIRSPEYRARMNLTALPDSVQDELDKLEQLLKVDLEITQKGYNKRAHAVLGLYGPVEVAVSPTPKPTALVKSSPTPVSNPVSVATVGDLAGLVENGLSSTSSSSSMSDDEKDARTFALIREIMDQDRLDSETANALQEMLSTGSEKSGDSAKNRHLLAVYEDDADDSSYMHENEHVQSVSFVADLHGEGIVNEKSINLFINDNWSDYHTKLERLLDTGVSNIDAVHLADQVYEMLNRRHDRAFSIGMRKLLDTFGDSLKYVNKRYNKRYGSSARKVPAHMPHMIDRTIISELQSVFPVEFDETSSHRLRSSTDMQYSFSYFYFLMSEPKETNFEDFWKSLDVDGDGVLNSNELRTLYAKVLVLPIDPAEELKLTYELRNCSLAHAQANGNQFLDSSPLVIDAEIYSSCDKLIKRVRDSVKKELKYKHELMSESEVAFKMIRDNATNVRRDLDQLRKKHHKFICLNDNIDHSKPGAEDVRNVLLEFYEAYFPRRSAFELPEGVHNEFLYMHDIEQHQYESFLKSWLLVGAAIVLLMVLTSRCLVRSVSSVLGVRPNRKHPLLELYK